MRLLVFGHVIKYNMYSKEFPGKKVFSMYPPKKGWRYVASVCKDEFEAPQDWVLSLSPGDGAIPVYTVTHCEDITASVYRPVKPSVKYARAYLFMTGGVQFCDDLKPV